MEELKDELEKANIILVVKKTIFKNLKSIVRMILVHFIQIKGCKDCVEKIR